MEYNGKKEKGTRVCGVEVTVNRKLGIQNQLEVDTTRQKNKYE